MNPNESDWLSPLNKLRFIKAALNLDSDSERSTVVTAVDGRTYQLSLKSHESQLCIQRVPNGKPRDYEPVVPLPVGYFEMETVLNPQGLWFERD